MAAAEARSSGKSARLRASARRSAPKWTGQSVRSVSLSPRIFSTTT
ncbi:Uncharacterised protein [Bordetella pertussis]|nr:Uncharacterised protein [Bordetella pertussis]